MPPLVVPESKVRHPAIVTRRGDCRPKAKTLAFCVPRNRRLEATAWDSGFALHGSRLAQYHESGTALQAVAEAKSARIPMRRPRGKAGHRLPGTRGRTTRPNCTNRQGGKSCSRTRLIAAYLRAGSPCAIAQQCRTRVARGFASIGSRLS